MFRRWRRTWAVLKSIIPRHFFGCSSVVLLIESESSPRLQIAWANERSSPDLEQRLAPAFLPNHTFRNFYGELIGRWRHAFWRSLDSADCRSLSTLLPSFKLRDSAP